MSDRTVVPRASFAVSVIDDVDYIRAMQTRAGRDAWALFVVLVTCAKSQRNDGVFPLDYNLISQLVRWPAADFKAALDHLITMPGRWVVKDANSLRIRSFRKWNSGWGGERKGAGRKSSGIQDEPCAGIQDGIKTGFKPIKGNHSDTDTDTDTEEKDKKTPLPPLLETPEIRALLSEFVAHRKAKRQTMTDVAMRRLIVKLERWGPERAARAIEHSLENGWTGVFEPDESPSRKAPAGTSAGEQDWVQRELAKSRAEIAAERARQVG